MDEAARTRLEELCDRCELQVLNRYEGAQQGGKGGGRPFHVTAQVRLTREVTDPRPWVYGEMVRRLFDDQLRALEDPRTRRA